MNSFRVHILAADHTFYDGPCESLIIPAPDGQYGIWAGHANTICAIIPGTLRLRVPEGAEQIAAVSSGVVKIEDNDVLVLVDSAERPEDIDRLRAQHAADAAKEAILQKRSIREYREAPACTSSLSPNNSPFPFLLPGSSQQTAAGPRLCLFVFQRQIPMAHTAAKDTCHEIFL